MVIDLFRPSVQAVEDGAVDVLGVVEKLYSHLLLREILGRWARENLFARGGEAGKEEAYGVFSSLHHLQES